ncbi:MULTISPECIES: small acid-soluble spore protein O [Bacillaceae]|jgi:small acid-soluble spore protein O|uniref:Small acid-soluble spore protein O n=1 Tax=Gottfriedia luciferensis TaxID=178774 RepID=A0ABX2ZU72_9BACI|nr:MULTISPECIES: small acid-soluble spore protein O [Bacillaceae]ODG93285.1 small acid-soluble spore protein O [Gottfriedia luciferensis]PET40836.1 small acid-soluble spore protein O [Bacillus sp. AFS001701]PFH88647.1 small acid-soluble spore protein O [Bacillus sp. AFS088145]PGM57471.1 small acid-soluble spore protein O [Bacillus sp. AFS053548]PGZ95063.1 small acid-soluble spore protein O [Bacillus sp. AFS029533]
MSRRKNNSGSGMSASIEQGKAAGFNEETAQEPLSADYKLNNKKTKKRQ